MVDLCTLDEAAEYLGVPKGSLETAAKEHGYLIRMGRARRLDRSQFGELIRKCQGQQKGRGSTSSNTANTGTSETPDSQTAQRAAQAAQKLKKPSARTSQPKGGQVLPMNRKT